jgi:hypothetical protein
MSQWFYCKETEQFGPVPDDTIQAMISSGELKPSNIVWREGMTDWQPIEDVSELSIYIPWSSQTSAAPPAPAGSGVRRRQSPHRGATVLVLGILGILVCFILGIIAWSMGSGDLKAMDRGRMDPSGRGLTQAGMVLGIISTLLTLGVFLLWLLMAGGMMCTGGGI